MAKQDYYQALGLEKGAGEDEVRGAYRKLAMRYHPDRNPEDESAADRFKEISEAYAVLSDDQKRQQYDMGGGQPFADGSANFSDVFGDFFSQFDTMFGGRRQQGSMGPQPGADLEYVLEISLEDALGGAKKQVVFPADESCDKCDGRGHETGGGPQTCSGCGGEGMVRSSGGLSFIAQTCARCGGAGRTMNKPCAPCRGKGLQRKKRKLQVDIPAGIDYGQSLRLTGQGGAGIRGGPSGDLYVRISVQEHPLFERDGDDLLTEIPLTFAQAALGDKIEIKTTGSTLRIKVPAGVQSGQVLRIAGQGAQVLRGRGQRGDLLCRVQVRTPDKLSKKQQDLLQQFAEQSDEKSNKSWMERIGKFLEAVGGN